MKHLKLTNLGIAALLLVAMGCNKEPAIEPELNFSTNLVNNTTTTSSGFTLYTSGLEGEFASYYTGADSLSTYMVPGATGQTINLNLDSVVISGYSSVGVYPFTVVVSSSGNWASEFKRAHRTININVVSAD